MKNKVIIMSVVLLLLSCGCKTAGIFGKSSKSISAQANKITQVDTLIASNNQSKLNEISELSYGTDYALNKVTNASLPVVVAKEMNTRTLSLAGLPPLDQQKAMTRMIEDLLLTNAIGKVELQNKDVEISALQAEETLLFNSKEKEINNLTALSEKVAMQNDTAQNELSKYTAYWGLGAVAMGIVSFAKHIFWTLLILVVLFIILRALSMTNPMAAAIFGIFQSIGASIVHIIETLIPQSINTLTQAKNDVTKLSNFVDNSINTIETTAAQPQAPLSGSK